MNHNTVSAFWDELEKIARYHPITGKFIPAVGEKLTAAARAAAKGIRAGKAPSVPGSPASRITPSGKLLPGAGTPRGVVPPPLPSHGDRARRLLAENPELAKRVQKGMGGEIQSAEGVLGMALRGSGGRTQEAIRRAGEIGQLNTKEVARIREAQRMAAKQPAVKPLRKPRAAQDSLATGAASPQALGKS